jgi:hypothetical protein
MTKIGRNKPCPCGSGKKYKRCHGNPVTQQADFARALRAHEAAEKLRTRSEGHGRPIIAVRHNNHWVVAVGKKLYWSAQWRLFPDFLLHFMKDVMGLKWGERESARSSRTHPLFEWLEGLANERLKHRAAGGGPIVGSSGGSSWAIFRFAYALYLIAHHDQIPNLFRNRLRDETTFLPAVYEALVGAAYAVAGYELRAEETKRDSKPKPEFSVRRGDATYSVEAKRKSAWKSKIDPAHPDFVEELQRFVRRELWSASRKKLPNPVYWLELSIPRALEPDEANAIEKLVRETLRDAERTIRLDGEIPAPAYVYVTSHAFLADHRTSGFMMVMLDGFHRQVFVESPAELETVLSLHDTHRDAIWILDCFREVALIPTSFEGVPAEALDAEGHPISMLRIGERTRIEFPDGSAVQGIIEEATGATETAYVAIHDESDGTRRMVTVPLSPEEQRAVAAHGDLVFGKPNSGRKLEENDWIGLYEFFLEGYRTTPRERLLSFLGDHPLKEDFAKLETEDLRRRICREWVKGATAQELGKRAEPTENARAVGRR